MRSLRQEQLPMDQGLGVPCYVVGDENSQCLGSAYPVQALF